MSFLPSVVNAEYLGEFQVRVTFNDGTQDVLDLSQWFEGRIFQPLKDPEYFRRFFVEGGAITWPNGADIAPETLYDAVTRKKRRNQAKQIRNGSPSGILTRRREKTTTHASKAESYFENLVEGRENFWTIVHDNYQRGEFSHEVLLALVDLGLRQTNGSYKKMAELFHVGKNEYGRLMDFLRRNECLLDFRPYRKTT
jgi:hypothetical protein